MRYGHSLSRRARLYVGVSRLDNDAGAVFTINSASHGGPARAAGLLDGPSCAQGPVQDLAVATGPAQRRTAPLGGGNAPDPLPAGSTTPLQAPTD